MRESCRSRVLRLIQQIKELQVNQKCSEVMLVLDDVTAPLLSSIVAEFLALGVKNVTKAALKKKPLPNCIGIYYISKQSIPCLATDFEKGPLYHSINLLLNEPLTHDLMQAVADNKSVTERLSYFGELLLNTNYLTSTIGLICQEDNLFAASLKNTQKASPVVLADRVLEAIISGFDDPPRLMLYHSSNPFIHEIVKELSSKYQDYRKQLQSKKQESKALRIVIMERRMDVVSPLVRNFFYLNMISDIFNLDFQHREVRLRDGSKVAVNFDDPIFNDYKNLHISKVQAKIEPDLQKFKTENKAAQLAQESSPGNKLSNLELKQAIKNIPDFNKRVKSYEDHINISLEITNLAKEQKLAEVGEIQQLIVSGVDGRGEEIKDKRIVEKAQQLCTRLADHQQVVKIMVLMVMCLEVSESQRKLFINKVKEYPEYSSLADFLQRHLPTILPKPLKLRLSPQKERLFLHMHESLVGAVVSELIEKGASKQVALSVVGEQPKKKTESMFQLVGKRQERQWLVVMLGGISLNEVVQLGRLERQYEGNKISILSSEVLTTWGYLDRLCTLFEQ